jgi:hypothetical protein
LHAHLAEAHGDQVAFEQRETKIFYGIDCPVCGDGYSHEINPRGRDPGFLTEFRAQISLVAFDMLVNHLLVEHDEAASAGAGEGDESEEEHRAAGPAPPAPGLGPAWLVEARRKAAAEERPGTGT